MPAQFDNVSVVKSANIYFDGKCISHTVLFPDGSRKITHITEVTGMEGDIVQLQDIFLFKQDGYDENGKIKGKFVATGNIPDFCQDLARRGIPVDLSIFQPPKSL